MNSCGNTCRMSWSAGIAIALAESITLSISASVTSLSLMATTPCEFILRIWLPAIPANTVCIFTPAINSASSTALWIDSIVASILTTTPFFIPREGCLPIPITFNLPSLLISPTSATTFDVPISKATIMFSLLLLAMFYS